MRLSDLQGPTIKNILHGQTSAIESDLGKLRDTMAPCAIQHLSTAAERWQTAQMELAKAQLLFSHATKELQVAVNNRDMVYALKTTLDEELKQTEGALAKLAADAEKKQRNNGLSTRPRNKVSRNRRKAARVPVAGQTEGNTVPETVVEAPPEEGGEVEDESGEQRMPPSSSTQERVRAPDLLRSVKTL